MDHKKHLITGVTATILMIGSAGYDRGASAKILGPGVDSSAPEPAKRSTEVEDAAELILAQLPASEADAKSLDTLLMQKELQRIKRPTAEQAIKMLLEDGDIKRVGDGSRGSPYRYFKRTSQSG